MATMYWTVHRTIAAFEEAGLVERRQFTGRTRPIRTRGLNAARSFDRSAIGCAIEFQDDAFDALKAEIAARFGHCLASAQVEIYANRQLSKDGI